jgi:eukaryotic-like serine/threonine-protein kinase
MTAEGEVKILDFGLAKHFVRLDSTTTLTVTDPQHTPGTVDYMSPEQLLGKRLDQRTDLYSLGVTLYEVLCGRRPFHGASTVETIAAILDSTPAPLPALPHAAEWRQILDRLLAKEPEQRYADAAALLRDLAVMREVVEGRRASLPHRASVDAAQRRPTLAVIPFKVQASAEDDEGRRDAEYFSHGLLDELMIALTRIAGLQVVPRTLLEKSTGKRESITKIARRVHADRALTGVIKVVQERLSIEVTLYDVGEKAARWTRRYKGAAEDLFQLRDEIVRDVAAEFRLAAVRDRDTRIQRPDIENRQAFHLCLKGRFHWGRRFEGGLLLARECFEEAIRLDPKLALAHAGLADTYSFLGLYCLVRPRTAFALAKESVERALELDPGLAEAHTSLGLLKLGGEWDWQAAIRAFTRAIELDPTHSPARIYLSWVLVLFGRVDEARAEAERAQDIDPLSPRLNAGAAYTFFLSREYERAIRECEKALEVDREYLIALYVMGMCKAQLGLYDDAIHHLERAVELSNEMPFYLGLLGKVYADTQQLDKVLHVVSRLDELAKTIYVPPHCHVYIHAGLGDADTAFEWQDQAFVDGASPFNYFSPVIESLHGDPRFKEDLKQWGLDV